MARVAFTVATHQTPEQFGKGIVDKVKSLTVDPVMTIYGSGGMLDKAAQKGVDRAQGVKKPDDYYVSKEEHARQLDAIIAIGGALFPEVDVAAARPPKAPMVKSMVTPEGVVVQASTEAAVTGTEMADTVVVSKGGGKSPRPKEPGKWSKDLPDGRNMNKEQAKYQRQGSRKSASETYYVGKRSFDGFERGTGELPDKLIEKKHLGDEGRFAKAYENMKKGNYNDLHNLMDRAENILVQARSQVEAAEGTGARVEWRVSGERATEALTKLFEHDPMLKGKIDVKHVPFDK